MVNNEQRQTIEEELDEARLHIYPISLSEYREQTGRTLGDVDFVFLTGAGYDDNYTVPGNFSLERITHSALLDMYRVMKRIGVDFALDLRFERDPENLNCLMAYALGVKKKQE